MWILNWIECKSHRVLHKLRKPCIYSVLQRMNVIKIWNEVISIVRCHFPYIYAFSFKHDSCMESLISRHSLIILVMSLHLIAIFVSNGPLSSLSHFWVINNQMIKFYSNWQLIVTSVFSLQLWSNENSSLTLLWSIQPPINRKLLMLGLKQVHIWTSEEF